MASTKEYLEYVLDQLSGLEGMSCRKMMGEYLLYYRDKLIGGIYDDRFLVKPVKSALDFMTDAKLELPYKGAKAMLLVEDTENKDFLEKLIISVYRELSSTGKREVKGGE